MVRQKILISTSLLLCTFIQTGFCSDFACVPSKEFSVKGEIYLLQFKSNGTERSFQKLLPSVSESLQELDSAKPSVLYIHGFIETAESQPDVISAYLKRGDVNVLAVDYSSVSMDFNYFAVVKTAPSVAKIITHYLMNISNIIDLRSLHIIGHSLGSHIAAFIARNLNVTIPRLTGLDPAFPMFYPSSCHIRASDAEVVSILHTDSGFYGTPFNTGTIDFYANYGIRPQPGCPLFLGEFCSHRRSVKIFSQVVLNPHLYPATPCLGILSEISKNPDSVVYFNDETRSDVRGAYCFLTGNTDADAFK